MEATMFSKKSNCKVYFLIWLVGTTPTSVATLGYCSWLLITKHSPVIYIYIIPLRIMGSQTCWFGDPNKNPAKNRVKTPLFGGFVQWFLGISIYHSETNPQPSKQRNRLKSPSSQSRPPVGLSVCVRDTLRGLCRSGKKSMGSCRSKLSGWKWS